MLEQQQPAAAPRELQLQKAESEFVGLQSRREALVKKMDGLKGENAWRGELRDELLILEDKIDKLQIETFSHRIALTEAQIPANKREIGPPRLACEAAKQRYLEAFKNWQQAAHDLHLAEMKVSAAESAISCFQRTIQEIEQRISQRGTPRDFSSEIEEIERKIWTLRAASGLQELPS